MSVRLRLLEQSWNLCDFIDYQLVVGVEKMYYKKYFKDEIEKYLTYLDAFEMLYRKKHGHVLDLTDPNERVTL